MTVKAYKEEVRERYNQVSAKFEPLIRAKAIRASRITRHQAIDYEDLLQEGRLVLVNTIQRYYPQPMNKKLISVILNRRFSNIIGACLAKARTNYNNWGDHGIGQWWGGQPLLPILALDELMEEIIPGVPLGSAEDISMFAELIARVPEIERQVIMLNIDPPIELLFKVRQEWGSDRIRDYHLAAWMGLKVSYYSTIKRRIRQRIPAFMNSLSVRNGH